MLPVGELTEIVTAVVMTATFTVSVMKFLEKRKEKKRIVSVKLSHGAPAFADGSVGRDILIVQAMNPGLLPVTLTSFGILLPNGSTMISRQHDGSIHLPYELSPGKQCMKSLEMIPVAESLARAGYRGTVNLIGFYHDALDVRHESKPLKVDVAMWMRIAEREGATH